MKSALRLKKYKGVNYHVTAQNITGLIPPGSNGVNHGKWFEVCIIFAYWDMQASRLMGLLRSLLSQARNEHGEPRTLTTVSLAFVRPLGSVIGISGMYILLCKDCYRILERKISPEIRTARPIPLYLSSCNGLLRFQAPCYRHRS